MYISQQEIKKTSATLNISFKEAEEYFNRRPYAELAGSSGRSKVEWEKEFPVAQSPQHRYTAIVRRSRPKQLKPLPTPSPLFANVNLPLSPIKENPYAPCSQNLEIHQSATTEGEVKNNDLIQQLVSGIISLITQLTSTHKDVLDHERIYNMVSSILSQQ